MTISIKNIAKKIATTCVNLTQTLAQVVLLTICISAVSFIAPQIHSRLLMKYVSKRVVILTPTDVSNFSEDQGFGGGTGYHLQTSTGKTYIVSNRHVCDLAQKDEIYIVDQNRKVYKRKILKRDPNTDLCLVEGLPGVDGLKLDPKGSYKGKNIAAIGHPSLQPVTLTRGEVVGRELVTLLIGIIGENGFKSSDCNKYKNRFTSLHLINRVAPDESGHVFTKQVVITACRERIRSIITTAPIWHGSSGSPVVDFWGRAVGTMFAIGSEGFWGRFVPGRDIEKLIEEFK